MRRSQTVFFNVLNMLAPVLLLIAIVLIVMSFADRFRGKEETFLLLFGLGLAGVALVLRIIWGIGLRGVRKKKRKA
jgi:chromate transport protein ChrA